MATVLSKRYVPDTAALKLRERLALALRILHREGYNDHALGHATMRQPGTDYLWTNGSGLDWEVIQPEDMVLIDWDRNVIHGRLTPNTAIGFHMRIYERRPDVQCIVHNHPRGAPPSASSAGRCGCWSKPAASSFRTTPCTWSTAASPLTRART